MVKEDFEIQHLKDLANSASKPKEESKKESKEDSKKDSKKKVNKRR